LVQVRVTELDVVVPVSVTREALREQAEPLLWVTPTVPVNPLSAETVIIELPGDPAFTTTTVGLADTVKSGGGGAEET
jgi:hypothetical protein